MRLIKHNKGDVKSTKGRRPFIIHFYEVFDTRSEAFKREQYYKSVNGYIYLKEQNII
ncbi:GIY-YIG nuclease family protein [Pedobacter agri]|uniref:GIY-YIG nuclease family protein n=1 Tax=Pedobacter agri TaxID=454586 RepID=UPI003742FA66